MLREEFVIIKEQNKRIENIIENVKYWPDFNLNNFINYVYENKNSIQKKSNDANHKLAIFIAKLFTSLERISS
jgi:hypothetical protein